MIPDFLRRMALAALKRRSRGAISQRGQSIGRSGEVPYRPSFFEPLEARLLLSSTPGPLDDPQGDDGSTPVVLMGEGGEDDPGAPVFPADAGTEIDIRGNGNSIVDGDTIPSVTDFTDFRQVGVTSTGLTAVTRTFSIHNTSGVPLLLTGSPRVAISGAHAADFTVTTQPATGTVAAGGSTTFIITFNPSAAGLRTASVTIENDDDDEGNYTFNIQGTGIETTTAGNGLQTATTQEGTGAGVTTGQGVRVFYTGYLTTGAQFDSNVGGNAFNFTLGAGQVIAGWDQGIVGMKIGEKRTLVIPANLAYGNNPPGGSGIPAGATLIFEVERVAGDISVGSPQSAVIPIASGDATPSIADHTDMGAITLGGASVSWTFRITATGAINLTGSPRVEIVGADASAFTVSAQPSTPIVPASGQSTATRDFAITFNPSKLGTHTATVSIASDDPDENPYTFAIQGTGIPDLILGAVEDTDFVVTHTMLNSAMKETGTSSYVIEEVESGQLFKGGVPVVPGVTTIAVGETLTWRPAANANRTLEAFTARPFVGGVGVGDVHTVRIEVTPVDDAPIGSIADITLGSAQNQVIDLAALFSDPDINGTIARITTSLGNIDVHLFDTLTPATVANFLNYATGGDYVNTIIHRVVANFIVQGGGFRPQLPASHITTDPAVVNEPGVSSQIGTIAMAKVGNQINSATSEWFFNLGDNNTNLDNQNGGFTVFGEVIGNGMTVVNDIAATPIFTDGVTLTQLPLRNYGGGAVQDANWIKVNSVTTIENLTFSIVGNTNTALISNAAITNGTLDLTMVDGIIGHSDITIRATDLTGRSVDVTFTVTVVGVSVEAIDDQASEPEGATPATTGTFRITRTGPTDEPLTVHYTLGGTADNALDYQALDLTVIIPAGQSFVDIDVLPLADDVEEEIETVILTLSASDDFLVGDAAATVFIFDDTPLVSITAIDGIAAETNTGQPANTGQFQITRTGGLSEPLTVHYTISGTATNGDDYALIAQSIQIPANESSVIITITPINDSISELAETVILSLASSLDYVVDNSGASATVTIIDNDPTLVTVQVVQGDVSENDPSTPGVVRFVRTGPLDQPLIVKFSISGKAKMGPLPKGDYTLSLDGSPLTAKTLTIPAGQAFVDVLIHVLDDTIPDAGETVIFKVAKGTDYIIPALPADQMVTLEIEDNEPTITIASTGFGGADAVAAETDAGQASNLAFFRIFRSGSTTNAVDVKFTVSGTAKINLDHVMFVGGVQVTGKTITIPAGEDHVDVFIQPVNDVLAEKDETVVLKLGANKSTYTLPADKTQHSATVIIQDNEPVISVTASGFAGADAAAAETNTGEAANTARFRINRTTNGPALLVGFKLSGTAKRGADYIISVNGQLVTGNTLVIPNGAAFVDVFVVPINDSIPEALETVILQLNINSTAYTRDPDPAKLTATVTIADNEPTVSVIAIDPTASEPGGTANNGTFRINRTGTTGDPLEVAFKLSGTAKAGTDYVKLATKVTIPAGAAFVDVHIEPLIDALIEQPETVVLTLGKGKTYNLDPNAMSDTVTIADGAPVDGADLVVLSVAQPAKTFSLAAASADLKITATIKNQGTIATTVASEIRVVLSKDRTVGAGDIDLGTMTLAPIAAGKTGKATGSFNITGLGLTSAAIGSYYLILVIDNTEVIIEAIEDNNTFASMLANVMITA